MANVIIFTDRAPRNWGFDESNFYRAYLTYPAGAYKIASVLRQQGLKVLVIPNCLHFSFKGIKHIIESNSKDLLWVGVSSTLLTIKSNGFDEYRNLWASSDRAVIGVDPLFQRRTTMLASTEMVWGSQELSSIAEYLQKKFSVPFLIGGAYVSMFSNQGNIENLHENCHIITGTAEKYIEEFTKERIKNKNHFPPYVCDNGDYDDVGFKQSQILWMPEDLITPDSVLPLEVSRGCAFNCAYCNYDRKSTFDSHKDPQILKEELIRNYETYGVTKYVLIDDLYNDSKQKVRDLYDLVWSQLPFQPEWSSYMRLDLIWNDRESAEFIKASGARLGSFGIETLDNKAGRSIGKGLGREKILETLEYLKECWKNEVLACSFFIAGLPHESLDSIKETMEWSIKTDLLYSVDWKPLWITPPSHLSILAKGSITQISDDNDKYGVKWVEPNIWENSVGVRFDQVDKLVDEFMQNIPNKFRVTFSDYADMRAGGLSHEQIVGLKTNDNAIELLSNTSHFIESRIDKRLNDLLNLHD